MLLAELMRSYFPYGIIITITHMDWDEDMFLLKANSELIIYPCFAPPIYVNH